MAFEPHKSPSFSFRKTGDLSKKKSIVVLTSETVYSNDLRGIASRLNNLISNCGQAKNEMEILNLRIIKLEADCKDLLREIDLFANEQVKRREKKQ